MSKHNNGAELKNNNEDQHGHEKKKSPGTPTERDPYERYTKNAMNW